MTPILHGDVINYIIAYYPGESLTGRLTLLYNHVNINHGVLSAVEKLGGDPCETITDALIALAVELCERTENQASLTSDEYRAYVDAAHWLLSLACAEIDVQAGA